MSGVRTVPFAPRGAAAPAAGLCLWIAAGAEPRARQRAAWRAPASSPVRRRPRALARASATRRRRDAGPSATPPARLVPIAGTWRVRKVLSRGEPLGPDPGRGLRRRGLRRDPGLRHRAVPDDRDRDHAARPDAAGDRGGPGRARAIATSRRPRRRTRVRASTRSAIESRAARPSARRCACGPPGCGRGDGRRVGPADGIDRPAPGADDHRFGGRVRRRRPPRTSSTGRRGEVAVRGDPPPERRPAAEHGRRHGRAAVDQHQGRGRHGLVLPDRGRHDPRARQEPGRAAASRPAASINYEWNGGDDRPAACAITAFPNAERRIERRTGSSGECTITKATVTARFTIHFPRWATPEAGARATARLVARGGRVHPRPRGRPCPDQPRPRSRS